MKHIIITLIGILFLASATPGLAQVASSAQLQAPPLNEARMDIPSLIDGGFFVSAIPVDICVVSATTSIVTPAAPKAAIASQRPTPQRACLHRYAAGIPLGLLFDDNKSFAFVTPASLDIGIWGAPQSGRESDATTGGSYGADGDLERLPDIMITDGVSLSADDPADTTEHDEEIALTIEAIDRDNILVNGQYFIRTDANIDVSDVARSELYETLLGNADPFNADLGGIFEALVSESDIGIVFSEIAFRAFDLDRLLLDQFFTRWAMHARDFGEFTAGDFEGMFGSWRGNGGWGMWNSFDDIFGAGGEGFGNSGAGMDGIGRTHGGFGGMGGNGNGMGWMDDFGAGGSAFGQGGGFAGNAGWMGGGMQNGLGNMGNFGGASWFNRGNPNGGRPAGYGQDMNRGDMKGKGKGTDIDLCYIDENGKFHSNNGNVKSVQPTKWDNKGYMPKPKTKTNADDIQLHEAEDNNDLPKRVTPYNPAGIGDKVDDSGPGLPFARTDATPYEDGGEEGPGHIFTTDEATPYEDGGEEGPGHVFTTDEATPYEDGGEEGPGHVFITDETAN